MKDKYIGKQFGCYEVLSISENKYSDGHKQYFGICVHCGFIREATIGCFKKCKTNNCTHINNGLQYYNDKCFDNERIRCIFNGMISRCYHKNTNHYNSYGGRGIRIYDEWINTPKSFEEWSVKNGYNDNLTIDRKDINGDYFPENCRWITREENAKWELKTNHIEVNGILDSGRGWSKRLGYNKNYINNYFKNYGLNDTINFIKSKIE